MALFLILYFGFDTKPPKQKAIEKSRALSIERINIQDYIRETKSALPPNAAAAIAALEIQVEQALADSLRVPSLQQLSGRWYELRQPAIAGYYAEQVAELDGSESAWSITGTTFTLCAQQSKDPEMREFCANRGILAYENAISMNPEEPAHRINLALLYTEVPPEDNPMQGILMLRELNETYPENVPVLIQLGRLGIQTGQYERAAERLEQALSIDPTNRNAACFLIQAYEQMGNAAGIQQWQPICNGRAAG